MVKRNFVGQDLADYFFKKTHGPCFLLPYSQMLPKNQEKKRSLNGNNCSNVIKNKLFSQSKFYDKALLKIISMNILCPQITFPQHSTDLLLK